jgi:ABC-type branched-subunit amino acid transport system ATPase component
LSVSASTPELMIDGVSAGYANHAVVRDVSLSVGAGEISCVVGPNGAGKSTLLRGITRDAQLLGGRVLLSGEDISQTPGNELVQRGLAWVPQLDDVFATLTVRENLELGGYLLARKQVRQRVREVLEVFPLLGGLADRVAGRLSGGERKLLAIARALMPTPSVVLLDEPTAGLSPEMTDLVLNVHITELSQRGVAVLLVEQRALEAIAIASHVHVMVGGLVRVSRPAEEIRDWEELARLFLGEV